jgi:hypothetical protein
VGWCGPETEQSEGDYTARVFRPKDLALTAWGPQAPTFKSAEGRQSEIRRRSGYQDPPVIFGCLKLAPKKQLEALNRRLATGGWRHHICENSPTQEEHVTHIGRDPQETGYDKEEWEDEEQDLEDDDEQGEDENGDDDEEQDEDDEQEDTRGAPEEDTRTPEPPPEEIEPREITCGWCHGSGYATNDPTRDPEDYCGNCGGTGMVPR